ncbi:MAG: glycosyltransferase family 2 protein [Myxococcota bacterium]
MREGKRICVVVPARDEARFVARVVATMPAFVDRTVVVDDGSVDDTGARAAAAGATVLRRDQNHGVGAAIVAGYRHALSDGADVVAVMAGDAQMDPEDLAAVVRPVVRGDADYVKGDRLRHPAWADMPRLRRWGTAGLAHATSWVAGARFRDTQCGYTAISAAALRRLDLAAVWRGYGYPNHLLVALAAADLSVAEVPVRPVYGDEQSGLRPHHVGTILWVVARARWRCR